MLRKITSYNQQFNRALGWNLLDTIGTQGLLILHHILLRAYAGAHFHGAFGCMLSLFYAAIVIVNLGLDASLAPFIKEYTASKKHFRYFLISQLLPQVALVVVALSIWLVGVLYFEQLDRDISIIIAVAFVCESIKKTLKVFLQLNFMVELTALTEIVGMICYMLLVWGIILAGAPLSLYYSWMPLLAVSIIQMSALAFGAYAFYQRLEGTHDYFSRERLFARAVKTRFFTWVNQVASQIFSYNFLVLFCGYIMGTHQASFLKIVSAISMWVTLIIQKAFGISSSALLAQTKNLMYTTRQTIFENLSSYMHQLLYGITIFLLITGKKLVAVSDVAQWSIISFSTLYLMILLTFTESFFTLYQAWFIIEEKVSYYLMFNLLSFSFIFSLYFLNLYTSLATLLISIIIIRLLTFFFLSYFAFYQFNIWPNLRIRSKTLIISLIASSICYLLI